MRNRWSLGFLVAIGLIGLGSTAISARAADSPLITDFSVATAKGVLQEWGATAITEDKPDTLKINDRMSLTLRPIRFTFGGVNFLSFIYCLPTGGCSGYQVICAFQDNAAQTATLNEYNAQHRAGKGYADQGGVVSEKYIIFDHGITRANVITQLNVYVLYTNYMLDFLKKKGVVASAPAVPEDAGLPAGFTSPDATVAAHALAIARRPDQVPMNKVP